MATPKEPLPGALKPAADSNPAGARGTSIPRQLGRFAIGARLGSGSFGAVYRAFDQVLKREVALKLPHAAALAMSGVGERFLREAESAAQLHHPNIVPIYDAGCEGKQLYIASAFIAGRTLQAALKAQPVKPTQAARLVMKLAEALAYAHSKRIVHRDMKPANVMLDAQGEPHLMDFGLARWEQADQKLTHDGSLLGTPAYMSPEQAGAPVGPVGPASDQYALGVVLYELLCGRVPFEHPLMAVVLSRIKDEEPERPRAIKPAIPKDLETICLKAMSKRPGDRYTGCSTMAEDLRRWLAGEPILARRLGPIERVTRWARKNKAVAGLATGVAVLLLVVAVMSSMSAARLAILSNQEAEARRMADQRAHEAEDARAKESAALHKESEARGLAEMRQREMQQSATLAEQRRVEAENNARLAEERRQQAEDSFRLAARYLYTARMNLAEVAWNDAHVQNVLDLLEVNKPRAGQEDLRGFEWFYWDRQCHGGLLTLKASLAVSVAFSPDGTVIASYFAAKPRRMRSSTLVERQAR